MRARKLWRLLFPLLIVALYMLAGSALNAFGIRPVEMAVVVDFIFIAGLFFYVRKQRPFFGRKKPLGQKKRWTLIALLFMVWLFGQISASWLIRNVPDSAYAAYAENMSGHETLTMALSSMLLSLVLAPVCEEFMMRSVMFNNWCDVNPYLAFFGSSFIFALMHGTIPHMGSSFLAGLFFALVYAQSGRIWTAVGFHFGYNLLSLWLTGLNLPGFMFHPAVFLTADILLVWLMSAMFRTIVFQKKDKKNSA